MPLTSRVNSEEEEHNTALHNKSIIAIQLDGQVGEAEKRLKVSVAFNNNSPSRRRRMDGR